MALFKTNHHAQQRMGKESTRQESNEDEMRRKQWSGNKSIGLDFTRKDFAWATPR